MREIDLGSSQLLAVGYVEGDHLLCSSLGVHAPPIPLGPPLYINLRGLELRVALHLSKTPGHARVVGVRDGTATILAPELITESVYRQARHRRRCRHQHGRAARRTRRVFAAVAPPPRSGGRGFVRRRRTRGVASALLALRLLQLRRSAGGIHPTARQCLARQAAAAGAAGRGDLMLRRTLARARAACAPRRDPFGAAQWRVLPDLPADRRTDDGTLGRRGSTDPLAAPRRKHGAARRVRPRSGRQRSDFAPVLPSAQATRLGRAGDSRAAAGLPLQRQPFTARPHEPSDNRPPS